MPVRLKITFLFSVIVFFILGIVCIIVYYFSLSNRTTYINRRLTSVAVTTGRFLSRAEIFNAHLIQKIDSLTAIAFQRKTVQAYDSNNKKIYSFNDDDADSLNVSDDLLKQVRIKQKIYLQQNNRDIVYYHYEDNKVDVVIAAAGYDVFGVETLRQLLSILLISFIVGVCIAVISGYIFSKRLLLPLGKIADDVNEISAQSLTRRIDTGRSRDEWYNLANTLNELLNRLQDSFDMQKRFIANASHELSTPLTAISSQLEVALQKERTSEEYRKTMESIYQDVHYLGKLTHTLLDFAKASGTKGGIETRLLRIDEIILALPAELSKVNSNYSVHLKFDSLPENEQELLVYGNEELLFTAINNITMNACKYSKDNQAKVFLSSKENNFIITVENRGSEIPAQEMEKIFEPFYRIKENRPDTGFGLGLSLAQRIIKLHRGEIYVSSTNGVTSFIIRLPYATNVK
jgi:two-component system sensor histidine kinase ArlS